jgi:hypothetical protein
MDDLMASNQMFGSFKWEKNKNKNQDKLQNVDKMSQSFK